MRRRLLGEPATADKTWGGWTLPTVQAAGDHWCTASGVSQGVWLTLQAATHTRPGCGQGGDDSGSRRTGRFHTYANFYKIGDQSVLAAYKTLEPWC